MDEMDKLDLAIETLETWLRHHGTCYSVIDPTLAMQVITPEMEAARCTKCLPCLTRKVLDQINWL